MAKNKVAVLQFEIERTRWFGVAKDDIERHHSYSDESQRDRLHYLARTAINDTIRNGGTFVLIAGKKTITMVQRADADEADEAALSSTHTTGD